MTTMLMKNAHCSTVCAARSADAPNRTPARSTALRLQRPKALNRQFVQRLIVATAVAATLGVSIALIAVTPRAVQALAVPPVMATVELPPRVIRADRLPIGACPVPTEAGATCPLPLSTNR